jgi:uncharacterized protein (DUF1697 family)
MYNYIAFLRGINVSGKHLIKMAELKLLFDNLGFKEAKTYIQSGNIIFKSEIDETKMIEKKIYEKIEKEFGFQVPVFVKSAGALRKVVENNPFIETNGQDINKLYVIFLNQTPNVANIARLNDFKNSEDKFKLTDDIVYLCCENGYGKTKLNNTFFENKLKVSATTRNWKTLEKMLKLLY